MVLKSYQIYSFPYTPKFSVNSDSVSKDSSHSNSRTSEILLSELGPRFIDSKPFQLAFSLFFNWGSENGAEQRGGSKNATEQHHEISLESDS
jgi:hypothetical protein